jgi:LemA protein
MSKPLLITLGVIAVIAVAIFMFFGGVYNELVTAEEKVSTAWAQVENVYQRRSDLVPNLVETVKGYAAHEMGAFLGVTEARAKISQMKISSDVINDPEKFAQFQAAQGALSSALSRLLVVVEKYPNLKANQNFLALQTQLEGTENRITVERRRFNEESRLFNTKIRTFPNNFLARLYGFSKKAYFEAEKGAESAPKVSF